MSLTSLGAGLIPTPVPITQVPSLLHVLTVTSNEELKRFGWSMPELFENPKTITVYKTPALGPTTLPLGEALRQVRGELLERDRLVSYSAVLRDIAPIGEVVRACERARLLLGPSMQGSRGAR